MIKVYCIKKCISNKYYIADKGSEYLCDENSNNKNFYTNFIYYKEKDYVYATIELFIIKNNTKFCIGKFDKRNFLTLQELREIKLNKIFNI